MRTDLWRQVAVVIWCCIGFAFTSRQASAQISQADLRAYTEWSIRTGKDIVPEPSFKWTHDELRYDLPDMHVYSLEAPEEPVFVPLTAQFTATAIRMYRNAPHQRRFWRPVLRRVEREIAGMLSIMDSGTLHGERLLDALRVRSSKIADIYDAELNRLAKKNGRQRATSQVSCCYPVSVELRTRPENGLIKYISAGRWSLYVFMTQQRGKRDYPKPEWITIRQLERVPLSGKNWFDVKWPNGAHIRELVHVAPYRQTITFTPTNVGME